MRSQSSVPNKQDSQNKPIRKTSREIGKVSNIQAMWGSIFQFINKNTYEKIRKFGIFKVFHQNHLNLLYDTFIAISMLI